MITQGPQHQLDRGCVASTSSMDMVIRRYMPGPTKRQDLIYLLSNNKK
jgi:hypothetical protein